MSIVVRLIILLNMVWVSLSWGSSRNYFVMGTNSLRGPYQGWISVDHTGLVKRIIQFNSFQFQNYKVQEAWIGRINAEGLFEFQTSPAHFIFKVNDYSLTEREAFHKQKIVLTPTLANGFINADGTTANEVLNASEAPVSLRFQMEWETRIRDVYSETPPIVKSGIALAKRRFQWNSDPVVKELTARSHCVVDFLGRPRAQSIEDFTDRSFYRLQNDIVRSYNSPATDLALAEGLYRKAAFGKSLAEKVDLVAQSIDPQFINSWGMNSYSVIGENGVATYAHDNDSALWTGEYLSFLGHQYAKTKKPELIQKIKKTANGLMLLVEAFEGTHEFGRTIEDFNPGEPLGPEWLISNVGAQKIKIKRGGNNDMFKGVLLGLTVASLTVPQQDQDFHERLQKVTRLILELHVQKKSNSTKLLSFGLAAIALKSSHYREMFIGSFENLITELYQIYDGVFYWNGTSDYSGVNLGIVGLYTSFIMAKELNAPKALVSIEEQTLMKKKTFGELRHLEVLLLLKKIKSDHLNLRDLQSLNDTLDTFPYPTPDFTVSYDHSWDNNFCLSPTPSLFWKAFNKKPELASDHLASLTNYPVYQSSGINSNYIFKDLYFKFQGHVDRHFKSSRIDLLFAWTLYDSE